MLLGRIKYAPPGSALQVAWAGHIERLHRRAQGVRGAFRRIYSQREEAVTRR